MNFTDEINIKLYAKVLIKGWFVLILFITVSFFVSLHWIKNSKPIFEVQTVIEFLDHNDKGRSFLPDFLQMGEMPFVNTFVGGDTKVTPSIARLLGNSFLSEFVTQSEYSSMLKEKCQYVEPSGLGFTYFLEFFDIYKLPPPTDIQKKAVIVDCLAGSIKVNKHRIDRLETNAYRISMQHGDPYFASTVLNGLVDFLFEKIRQENIEKHDSTLEYLADQVSSAQIEAKKSEDELAVFLSKNPTMVDQNAKETQYRISKIKRLEKQTKALSLDLEIIRNLLQKKIDFEQFIATEFNKLRKYSKSMEGKIDQIKRGRGEVEKDAKLQTILSEEKRIQEELLFSLKQQLSSERNYVKDMISLGSKYETLNKEVLKRKAYLQSLLAGVEEKNFALGLDGLNEDIIHSIAVPPIMPVAPKPKLIVVVFGTLFFLLGCIALILRQMLSDKILDISQVQRKFPELLAREIKSGKKNRIFSSKDYDFALEEENSTITDVILDRGKSGCIFSLGSKRFKANICSKINKKLANGLASSGRSVLYLESEDKSNKLISKTEGKIQGHSISYDLEAKVGNVSQGSYKTSKGTFKISNFLVDGAQIFNNILFSPAENRGFLAKRMIDECEFFVIVGECNNFTGSDLSKIIGMGKKGYEKCAGIILAD